MKPLVPTVLRFPSLPALGLLGLAVPIASQATLRASLGPAGTQGNHDSYQTAISGDGRLVVFYSEADNLVLGDTNGFDDVFVRDLASGTTKLVSVDSRGTQGNEESEYPAISVDGRFAAFLSEATNLVPDDTNGERDVFVRDLFAGLTTRVSVATGGGEGQGPSGSFGEPAISADGRFVVFYSLAPNLVPDDVNGDWDLFVHDRVQVRTRRVNVDSNGAQAKGGPVGLTPLVTPAISADGRFVAFSSTATNLVPNDTNRASDVFVRDIFAGTTARVSVSSSGAQGDRASGEPSLSADGRFVAFTSSARNLVSSDSNGLADIFVHDRLKAVTTRVSLASDGVQANGYSITPTLSADGHYVAFRSGADNLVPGDTNQHGDIFLHDRASGTIRRVSLNAAGGEIERTSYDPRLSADGHSISYWSASDNIVPGDSNGVWDIFVIRIGARKLR